MVTERRIFPPGERPVVDVLVDGVWRRGELRMWIHHDEGGSSAQVQYRSHPGAAYLDTVSADRIRPAGR